MKRLTFSEAKQISIVEYLSSLGFEPARIRGVDHWYHAPGRADKEPSFKVDAEQNVWYDHGEGAGGTIIDLGMLLHQCTPVEFLDKLSDGNYRNDVRLVQRIFPPEQRDNMVEIQLVKPLTNTDLLFYINQRGIDTKLAEEHCKEIDFSIKGKLYHAIGFGNRSGGWELRNAWLKGASSPKDITVVELGHPEKLSVCEGFIDYLSLLKVNDPQIKSVIEESDFLVLNSLSFLHKNYDILNSYKEVNCFLDNDPPAQKAKDKLIAHEVSFKDRSSLYASHKDVNEFLVHSLTPSIHTLKKSNRLSL